MLKPRGSESRFNPQLQCYEDVKSPNLYASFPSPLWKTSSGQGKMNRCFLSNIGKDRTGKNEFESTFLTTSLRDGGYCCPLAALSWNYNFPKIDYKRSFDPCVQVIANSENHLGQIRPTGIFEATWIQYHMGKKRGSSYVDVAINFSQ